MPSKRALHPILAGIVILFGLGVSSAFGGCGLLSPLCSGGVIDQDIGHGLDDIHKNLGRPLEHPEESERQRRAIEREQTRDR